MKVWTKKQTQKRWALLLALVMCISVILPATAMSAKAETKVVKYEHDFTADGVTSDSFFTISNGNIGKKKGTVTYNGVTYTSPMKMQKTTSVKFTAPKDGELVLVFGGTTSAVGKTVKLDGTEYTVDSDNICTIAVTAGSHEVGRGDTEINLFYMVYSYTEEGSSEEETTKPSEEETTKPSETEKETTKPSETESTTTKPADETKTTQDSTTKPSETESTTTKPAETTTQATEATTQAPTTPETGNSKPEQVVITKATGWLETAYVEWDEAKNASSYNVYVKKSGEADTAYVKLDNELVRKYKETNSSDIYFRADALGLAAGDYVLKVVPAVNGTEYEESAAVAAVTVEAHDRTGFAWTNGEANGAYRDDGTLKGNAVVLYVTEQTKDTVTMDVVKNAKGQTETATGLQNILNLYKKGYDSRPLNIRIIGCITDLSTMDGGDIVISGSSSSKRISCGITVEGVGSDATVSGWGIRIKNASNVEVRNLGIMLVDSSEGDNIGLQQENDHIWVHNCDFFYGEAGGDSDQAKGDGALDCKKSTYVTFSYNHFFDNGKCNLLGLSEGTTEDLYITYHHNWYDHSDSRHPRIRYYSAHVYNNYYDGNSKYGIGSTKGSSVFSEGNYFRNCKYPMLTSMQGSDVIADWSTMIRDVANMATFSKEDGGTIKSYNNYIEGATSFVSYQENSTEFDAYVVQSADEKVPSTVKSYQGSHTYNNFDTSAGMYSYTADSPEVAKTKVEKYAGRVEGGDFKWTFTAADDTSYAVNTELKAALRAYKTCLLEVAPNNTVSNKPYIGTGEQETTTSHNSLDKDDMTQTTTEAQTKETDASTTTAAGTTAAQTTTAAGTTGSTKPTVSSGITVNVTSGSKVQNITADGKTSSFYTISGNLASNKGTVTVNGLTLTKALKLESPSKMTITFTAAAKGTLTMVLGSGESGTLKLNDTAYTVSNGYLEAEIEAGSYTITRASGTMNLFYMVYTPEGSEEETTTAAKDETETTTAASKPGDSNVSTGYDKNSLNFSGAYTSLSTVKDSQYLNKLYAAPDGSAAAAGTKDSPMDLETAISKAGTGTAIILLEGTYAFDHQVTIPTSNSGTQDCYKVLKAADGAKVTLDFSSQPYDMKDTSVNARGLQIEGNYWYVYGITVYGAADNGIFVAGSHNVIERCILQANRDTGLQISRRSSSVTNKDEWPSYNYIINCTSFDNSDPATGENADGFAAKLTCGEGNVFDGCISYCNCDDGWDLYAKQATGSIGVVTIRNCIAFNNGTLTNGNSEANGDMNGFKLGGSNGKVPTPHFVFNCLAFNNGKDGFTDNGNGGSLTLLNCTSYNNAKTNFNFYRTTAGGTFFNLLSASGNGTDKFIGKISNTISFNSKKYYQVPFSVTGTDVTSGQKLGTVVSDPFKSGAFSATEAPDVTADIDSIFRNADGTVTTNGYLMSTGDYASMGAKFNVDNQVLAVKAAVVSETPEEPTKPEETTAEDKTEATKPEETTTEDKTEATKPEETTAEDKTEATKPEGTTAEDKTETTKPEETTQGKNSLSEKSEMEGSVISIVIKSDNDVFEQDDVMQFVELKEGEAFENVLKALSEYKDKLLVVDISILRGTEYVHEFPGGVCVTLDIPDGYNSENVKVYRMESDGSLTDMKAVCKDGKAVFTTEHFSTYVIVDESTVKGSEAESTSTDKQNGGSVKTADESRQAFYLMLMTAAIAGAGVVATAKRKDLFRK